MLAAENLSYFLNEQSLFQRLNFTVNNGEVLQIFGINGAGKTTLLRILSGLLTAASGEVFWDQKPIRQNYKDYCRDMVFLGHKPAIKLQLTVAENLRLIKIWGQALSTTAISQVLQVLHLSEHEYALAQTLSVGQQRRLHLARLLLVHARLWILDEPFIALDSSGINWMENLLVQHISQGGSVVMTSHQPFMFQQLNVQRLHLNEY